MNTSPVRMDDLPLNGFHCRIAALTFGAHLVDGYILGVIGYAIIQLTPAMHLSPFMAGMVGGAALLGLFIGSLILGWVSDHIGRQKIFNFSFVLITIASFLQFFATTPEQLIGLRILIGIGLGGDYSVGHTLLAEFSPRRHRGVLLGAFSVVWTVGYVLASLAGHYFISENQDAWRWLLASSALPALLITLLRWGTPESPRWLMRQGRFAEAHAVVLRCFGPHVLLGDEVKTSTNKRIRTLFSSRYWRRTAFNSIFFVCLVIPWFVIYTWLPTIAETIGLEDALTASLLLNALLIVGALLGLVLTHLLSHRHFLLGSFLLLAAVLIVMACLPSGSPWDADAFRLIQHHNFCGQQSGGDPTRGKLSHGYSFAGRRVRHRHESPWRGNQHRFIAVDSGAMGDDDYPAAIGRGIADWFYGDLAVGAGNQSAAAGRGRKR